MRNIYGKQQCSLTDTDKPVPYKQEITVSGDTTTVYTCFYNTNPCGIQKDVITVSGDTTTIERTFAMAAWDDRATATYVPINECWNID